MAFAATIPGTRLDLLSKAQAGRTGRVELNSTWRTGDWDRDGEFTTGDLVVALADGGYEAGAAAVPEPAGNLLPIGCAAFIAIRIPRRSKTRRD